MGTVDFGSEPAYWYEKTMRSSEAAGLPIRRRAAISRDEALIAREVRQHLDRIVTAAPSGYGAASAPRVALTRICGVCNQSFSRAEWRQRRVWRSIYPRGAGRVDLYRHSVCPHDKGK